MTAGLGRLWSALAAHVDAKDVTFGVGLLLLGTGLAMLSFAAALIGVGGIFVFIALRRPPGGRTD